MQTAGFLEMGTSVCLVAGPCHTSLGTYISVSLPKQVKPWQCLGPTILNLEL